MRRHSTDAGKWIAENGLSWGKKKSEPHGTKAKMASYKTRRLRRAKNLGDKVPRFESITDFVKRHREYQGDDCLFVPGAQDGVPAGVSYLGNRMSAARYMCLLAYGTPKSDGMVVRHLCGNGHLSCINPKHLAWGTDADNISDMALHRKAGDDVQDRISAVVDR